MPLHGRDLRAGLSGEDVALLHEELMRLGFAVPDPERAQRLFGVGTAKAVAAFQTANGLVDTAVVDTNTAAVLDRALAELATPATPAAPPGPVPPVVPAVPIGRVPPVPRPPRGQPAEPPSGQPPSEPPGQPPSEPPGRPPSEPPGRPPSEPPGRPPSEPPGPPPGRPPAGGPKSEPAPNRLAGSLFASRGTPAAGVTVRFYLPGFGGKLTPLGETVTGPDGSYVLDRKLPADLTRLQVRAVGVDGAEVDLIGPADQVDPNAPINVVIPVEQLPPPEAEFSRLAASLRPHLNGGTLAIAEENGERRDLTLLHEATGWDARLLALGAAAEQLATTTGVETPVAYGLLRAGLPTDPVQLARISPAGIGHALRKAVEAGVVALDDRQISEAQAKLGSFGRATRRQLAINGTASSYGSMLKASGLTGDQQDRFDEIFSAHDGDAASLWQQAARADLPVDQLKLTAQLGTLTLNSARLTESLRAEAETPERLADTLVSARLYQPEAWQKRLRGLANGNERVLGQMIPPVYQAETTAERLQAYTADLAFKVRRSFPTQVLSDRLRTGELPLAAAGPAVTRDVVTVLDRAADIGFVPGQRPLHRLLTEQEETLFAGMSRQRAQAATVALTTLTRQYQITASDEALAALQRHQLHSAAQVSAIPERMFLARYGADFPSPAEASLTWRRAQQVTAVTLNLVTAAKQLDSARLLPALAAPAEQVSEFQGELVKQFPTLESLFGSLDFCECQHCRSVLSPAAYLVDLLKFLDDAPAAPKNPYLALTERRPDLPHLPLTCENTHTALPYIDIVNEILEFFLVHEQLGPDAAYDTGGALSADLIAEPQNLLPAAYDLLKQARYPLTAPFDLWLATVRAFTSHFQVPFGELLEALRPSDALRPVSGYGLAAVAYERLGFAPAEVALLSAANAGATWPARYGYPENAGPAVWGELAGARTLARRLGVTYHELVALLQTRFVNPQLGLTGGDPLVLADPAGAAPCSWEETTLRHAGGAAAAPIDFLLLNQFVRIWRRLGWSMADTDQALVTFLPTTPDPRTVTTIGPATASALLGVARLQQLATALSATDRQDLLVLWAPLSDGRYEELFLTGTAQTRDPVFEGEPGSYLTTAGVLLSDHREAVQAALRLPAEAVDQVLAAGGLDPATVALDMATVSLLHRHGVLARLLKVSVADLLVLIDLTGLDPFTQLADGPVSDAADDHPYRQTIRFVETVRDLTDAGLTTSELDYLVRHRFDPVGPHRAAALPPLALVQTVAAEVARIRAEYAVPADALTFTDEAVARTLALVLPAPVVAAFLAAWTTPDPALLPDDLFSEHLRRRVIPGVGEVGFLDQADLDPLFNPPAGDQAADAARRGLLAGALLPYVRQQLTRQAVVAAVAADRDADPALVDALLTNPMLLDDPETAGVPLLDAYLAATASGLSMSDGQVTGFLELPASGGYQFEARCAAAGTSVVVRFDHLSEPALVATSAVDALAPAAELELRGGVPYGFTLTYPPGAEVELWVRGRQLAATPVRALLTYPRTEVDRLHRRHLLLSKVLRLAAALGLTEPELRHLLTHPDDFDGLDLGSLPTVLDIDPARAQARIAQLVRLVGYARLRRELAAEPADLVAVLAHARRTLPAGADPTVVAAEVLTEVTTRLAEITRREPAVVAAAAQLLGMAATVVGGSVVAVDFTQERGLARLWRVLALATRIGVDPAALGRWATPSPDAAVAKDVRDTVQATYPPETWRRVAQPIFDLLRQQRRDALVAQVLQVTGYQRVEQLFEHFLVDPGTEPVVHTSRLRLAISSVQTFIQRCLLNLEDGVAPSSINSDYWEWMKRYRVWEANRKIFLWPENWLEPEFRDDKTHLFTELESALLESDLDTPAVEAAFFGYLRGLEQIARLDIRTIYLERKPDPDANVLHVVARTPNAPHKYFYRTWSRRSWTPWQPITANIDGDHLAVVRWQGRVHLFWVVMLPQAEQQQSSSTTHASDLTLQTVTGLKPRKKVEVQLYWSCFTPGGAGPGEWSDPALATVEDPQIVTVNADFLARRVFIWADVLTDGSVSISLLGQGAEQTFRVTSRHVPPRHTDSARVPLEPPYLTGSDQLLVRAGQGRWKGTRPKFRVHVEGETVTNQGTTPCDITEDILSKAPSDYQLVIVPPPAKLAKSGGGKGGGKGGSSGQQPVNRPEDPFFYLDADHTFFVEPDWIEFSLFDGDQALAAQSPVWHQFDSAEFWAAQPVAAAFPQPRGLTVPPVVLGSTPIVKPDDLVTRPQTLIRYGGELIGSGGLLSGSTDRLFRTGPQGTAARTDA